VQGLALARAFDWSATTSVCDVGGGTGVALEMLLAAHPHLAGTLLDLPEVVARARPFVRERCQIVAGDFFSWIPPDCDHYTLLAVIHDWDDDDAGRILCLVRDALRPGATAIVVESVLPERPRDDFAFASDLLMLVLGPGRERTRAGFDALFTAAGLTVRRTVTLATGFTAFELTAAR
jgi:hypothetical protein